MAKKTSKKKSEHNSNFITTLVLTLFKQHPKIKSKEMIRIVGEHFPRKRYSQFYNKKTGKLHFNVYHYSWFKYQIKKGRYTKHFDKTQLRKIFKEKVTVE